LRLQSSDGAAATVLLQGAHVVSWTTPDGQEQLYLSPRSAYAPGVAVRGGVPVIFPQFESWGPLPRHGMARTAAWRWLPQGPGEPGAAVAVLAWGSDEHTRAIWPFEFEAELTVAVSGERLDIELAVCHVGPSDAPPLRFTAALHTYLAVQDVCEARLSGLQGLPYRDAIRQQEGFDEQAAIRVEDELDRIYRGLMERPLQLLDGERRLQLWSAGFPDAVVWNPGGAKCAQMKDMPQAGWRSMLCVEAAAVFTPIELPAGESWMGRQSLLRLA
jgi:glucose-6-phosphate 1-epimerase